MDIDNAVPCRQETTQEATLDVTGDRPRLSTRHTSSTSSYGSPRRHHHRNPTTRRPVKETLNARSEYTTSQDDGTAEHMINQYVIKQEMGRGSFGAVHLAVDQFGNEYAVKEFSKSRLRKRAQSHLLRRPRGPKRPEADFNAPLHRHSSGADEDDTKNALHLIREEIAIMKKLNHPNLVSLVEVLDDPTEDSLYMVMEMCKKGVIMRVSLEERADPYDDDSCRCWFRDLILGIEYLHAQGIAHRDIKPDNCLLTNEDVVKVVDFGVSEMFAKDSDMYTAKSAGSPAFLPPELCVAKHGDVSGKAADIWSMGVTLYCLRYGRLPFEKDNIFELYEAIRSHSVAYDGETDQGFEEMMSRLLEKDPAKRITMNELREHSWVTRNGIDPLLSEEENTAAIVSTPTEEEMNSAITAKIGHLFVVMKAARRFKRLIQPSKPGTPVQSVLGQDHESQLVEPPLAMESREASAGDGFAVDQENKAHESSCDRGRTSQRQKQDDILWLDDKHSASRSKQRSIQTASRSITSSANSQRQSSSSLRRARKCGNCVDDHAVASSQPPSPQTPLSRASSATKRSAEGTRGHARDPLAEEHTYLFIGPSTYSGSPEHTSDTPEISEEPEDMPPPDPSDPESSSDTPAQIVSESPGAAEFEIYETAYRKEIERIRERGNTLQTANPTLYLTRRVEGKADVLKLVGDGSSHSTGNTRSATAPAIGTKNPFHSAAQTSGISGIKAQLGRLRETAEPTSRTQHPPPPLDPSAASIPDPATSSCAASGTTSDAQQPGLENSRTKLLSLLGRVKGNRNS